MSLQDDFLQRGHQSQIIHRLNALEKAVRDLNVKMSGWNVVEDVSVLVAAASIDFQNIPPLYRHLKIVYKLRSSNGAASVILGIRLNNDSGNNYDSLRTIITSAGLTPTETIAGSSIQPALLLANGSAANKFSQGEILFPDYTCLDADKAAILLGASMTAESAGNIHLVQGSGYWRTENVAVSRITLLESTGGSNIMAGSRATLYGLK